MPDGWDQVKRDAQSFMLSSVGRQGLSSRRLLSLRLSPSLSHSLLILPLSYSPLLYTTLYSYSTLLLVQLNTILYITLHYRRYG